MVTFVRLNWKRDTETGLARTGLDDVGRSEQGDSCNLFPRMLILRIADTQPVSPQGIIGLQIEVDLVLVMWNEG